ncbi:MAG: TatD family hydrolase [Candidatus Diapherotrites archaeon]|nr:TatD family hydrolase [Candidatus Diapherotrites archaeon]
MFADSHCHLFELPNLNEIVQNARTQNVQAMLSASTTPASNAQNLALRKKYPQIHACLGIHPSEIIRMNETEIATAKQFIEEHLHEAIAVGEVGLDFKDATTKPERDRQRELFAYFIELALTRQKPLIVHSRFSADETLRLLAEKNASRVLMHWFTGSKLHALQAIRQGYFVSAGSSLLFGSRSDETIAEIPSHQLLLETDTPVHFNHEMAEPAWIPRIAQRVSEIHQTTLKETETLTFNNALKLFGKKIIPEQP